MAGDHRCPVCQATFTRPQHVARHMRSHTGDRPYKCQYCGDQFARSDLLARHINKCHANEKPLPNTVTSNRRKGAAAASRAVTSKQACDQCVQASLPCDGANPCSKCASRKCRCTYVKFHRQTAPSGPGHHPPRSPTSSLSPLGSRLSPHHSDLFLALPPPSSTAPLSAFPNSDNVFNTPFTFNPTAPPYAPNPNWTTDMAQVPFTMPPETELHNLKYARAQADLMRRASGPAIIATSSPTLLPSMYPTQPQTTSGWYPAWGESGAYPALDDTKPFEGIARTHSFAVSEPPSFAPDVYSAGLIGSAYRPRRVSLDFSDSSSATSQSVPSSASSSNVHLPLSGNEMFDGPNSGDAHINMMQHARRSSIPTSLPPAFPGLTSESGSVPSTQAQQTQASQPQRAGEGGFSSTFGLMSIDDPNMLRGLSSDGVPFFSNLGMGVLPHSPNATPMPTRVQQHGHVHPHTGRDRGMSLSALPTPRVSKDLPPSGDTPQLKDMWKTYMRSPLSGSGPTTSADMSQAQAQAQVQMSQSPSGQRRRVRLSSLPSVTPTVEKGHPWMVHGHGDANGHGQGHGPGPSGNGTPGDDLRSYEAAVNARSASLKLNLVPRRKGRLSVSGGASPQTEQGGSEALPLSASTSISGSSSVGQVDQLEISRPSSSSSSSSLAQAFTVPTSQPHSYHHPSQGQQAHGYNHHTLHPHPYSHSHSNPNLPVSVSTAGLVKPPPMQGASISLPLPIPPSMSMASLFGACSSSTSLLDSSSSRASSVTSDGTGSLDHGSPHGGTNTGSGSDSEAMSGSGPVWSRPTFKRHSSQTLGPASCKRALVERPGGRRGVRRDHPSDGDRDHERTHQREREEGGRRRVEERMNVVGEKEGEGEEEDAVMVTGIVQGSPGSGPMVVLQPERART